MNKRFLFASFVLCFALSLVTGCTEKGLYVTVHNASKEKIFNMGVVYGSGSYTIPRLEPGEKYHSLIGPLYPARVEFRFEDSHTHMHFPFYGPNVGLEYQGQIHIYVEDDNKVRFEGTPVPTPGVEQPKRDEKEEQPFKKN